jgi:hypothetical protein
MESIYKIALLLIALCVLACFINDSKLNIIYLIAIDLIIFMTTLIT